MTTVPRAASLPFRGPIAKKAATDARRTRSGRRRPPVHGATSQHRECRADAGARAWAVTVGQPPGYNVMWEPDTAVRCVREVAFMASDRSEGNCASSPIAAPWNEASRVSGEVRTHARRPGACPVSRRPGRRDACENRGPPVDRADGRSGGREGGTIPHQRSRRSPRLLPPRALTRRVAS